MMASTTNKLRKPLRGAAIALAVVGVAFAGNSALGLAGDDTGRDGSTVPGAPSDAPAPVDDSDAGRNGGSTPGPSSRSAEAPALGAISDNGRGFADPASGPNPVTRAASASTVEVLTGYDTDSGEAPVANAGPAVRETSTAPVDQDVAGAPTGGPAGADAPSNDQDG